MNDYERDVLRHIAGEDVPGLTWGAAMSEAVEWLFKHGYVGRLRMPDGGWKYLITDAGRALLIQAQAIGARQE